MTYWSSRLSGRSSVARRTFQFAFGVAAPPWALNCPVHRAEAFPGRSLHLVIPGIAPSFGGTAGASGPPMNEAIP